MNHDAFLREICACPADDVPRLIYADWLEENGQSARAEFIRTQIELAKPGARGGLERRRGLRRRVRGLWAAYGAVWAERPGGGNTNLTSWERGFCSFYAAETAADLFIELPGILQERPVDRIRIKKIRRQDVPYLAALSGLAQVRELNLWAGIRDEHLGDAEMRLLANSPYLHRLERLDLTQHEVGLAGLRALVHSPNVPNLCELALYANPLGTEGVRVLSESPAAARLRYLHMTGGNRQTPLDSEGARLLAENVAFGGLRELNLDQTTIGNRGARLLSEADHLTGLRRLTLHACEIGNAGVRALADSPHLAKLRRLDLSTNWTVGHIGAVALIESPYLRKLRYLDLWRCERLSKGDERQLRKRFGRRVNFERSH